MSSLIVVHPTFEAVWPFVCDHLAARWRRQGETYLIRLARDQRCAVHEAGIDLSGVERLIALNVAVTCDSLGTMPALKEIAITRHAYGFDDDETLATVLQARGIRTYQHRGEGFWGQSVSEFALALTLCGLRRIPQTYRAMMKGHDVWDYRPAGGGGGVGGASQRGEQFGDDARFSNGTVERKRVRIVGAGNIASRYASFMNMLGADVAAWDPFAADPCFHRAGTRREYHLEHLVCDAEIFAPMLPLNEGTRGLVTGELINALPRGCLVVLATRAMICDMPAIRRRVLHDEIALAADVFDVEPLPLDDPLLCRHNVIHTPHNAGRTKEANFHWADMLLDQFLPR